MTPLESHIKTFSFFRPSSRYNFVHAIAAAPAPLTTTFTSSIFLWAISKALIKAAAEIIAVPC